MSGGYGRVRIDPISVFEGARNALKVQGRFDGGLNLEMSTFDMPLNQSPNMHCCRIGPNPWTILGGRFLFHDWGSTPLGTAAGSGIQALGNRQGDVTLNDVAEVFRVWFDSIGGNYQLDVYDTGTSDFVTGPAFPVGFAQVSNRISHETFQGDVLFAAEDNDIANWTGGVAGSVAQIAGVSADYVSRFADRAILLRAGDDLQRIRYSVNGDHTDYVGVGSGDLILDSRSPIDPIDALVGLVPMSSEVAALFRAQSIWRVTRTGSGQAPLAFTQWIDSVGMPSSYGAAAVPGGIVFVGSDSYAYYLTEGGLIQLGRFYYRPYGLYREGAQAIYIPSIGEFRVNHTLPSGVDQGVNTLDLSEFLLNQNRVWTFRDFSNVPAGTELIMQNPSVARPVGVGTTTDPVLIYSTDDQVFRFLVPTIGGGVEAGIFGSWDSPSLNRENRFADYTLKRIAIRFLQIMNIGTTATITVSASTDGGKSFRDSDDSPKTLVRDQTLDPSIRRMAFHWNEPLSFGSSTGADIRFRVEMNNDDHNIGLDSWEAELVDRGDQAIPAAGDDV